MKKGPSPKKRKTNAYSLKLQANDEKADDPGQKLADIRERDRNEISEVGGGVPLRKGTGAVSDTLTSPCGSEDRTSGATIGGGDEIDWTR